MEQVMWYTVLGQPVRILADDLAGDCPIAAVRTNIDGSETLMQLRADGQYYEEGTSAYDIRLGKPTQEEIEQARRLISDTIYANDRRWVRKMLEAV